MPNNATILIIRHGEKPESGDKLSPQGYARSYAYVAYFDDYKIDDAAISIDHIKATENSAHSHRPHLTVKPTSKHLNIPIKADYADDQYQEQANEILQKGAYDNSTILICWHHGKLLDLAQALGVDASALPSSSNWPSKWPSDVFGWTLQIRYDSNGNVIPQETLCKGQNMMYDDYGQDPGSSSTSSSSSSSTSAPPPSSSAADGAGASAS